MKRDTGSTPGAGTTPGAETPWQLLRRAYSRDLPLGVATCGILAVAAVYAATLPELPLFDWYQGLFGVLAITIWAILSGLRRVPQAAERRLWAGIALAFCAHLAATVFWVFSPDAYFTTAGQLFEELCFLVFYLALLFSIELQPHRVVPARGLEAWRGQRRFELRGGILFVLGLLVSFVIIPIRGADGDVDSYVPSGCLYVALDLLILARTVQAYRGARSRRWRTLYRGLLAAESAMFLADSADLLYYLQVYEEPVELYSLWYLYPLLFAVAARLRHVLPAATAEETASGPVPELSRNPFSNILLIYTLLLPALHLLLLYFRIFDETLIRPRIAVVLLYIFAFLVLIGRRQRFEAARIHALEAERRRGEEELRDAMSAAQAASAMKSQFLANMSHEIRTPMNGILGAADLLLRTPVDERQREYLHTIRTSGDTLVRVIDDILDLSRIESGRLTLHLGPCDLRAAIEDALDLLAPIAAKKQLALSYRAERPLCPRLVSDPTRVRQVLVNLLNNAIKFTDRGEVSVLLATRPLDDGRHEAHLTVEDTGIGIPAEGLAGLFEPFSQVDPSSTRRHGGSGLGLAICHRLCELLGGRIWVESTVGEGSAFHFTVRGLAAAGREPAWTRWPSPWRHGPPALIVDPSAAVRRFLTVELEAWEVAARATADAGEAGSWLAGPDAFALAIVDAGARLRDEPLAAAARRRRPGLPIVLTSAAGGEAAPFPGAPAVRLEKPIRLLRLRRALDELHRGGSDERRPRPVLPDRPEPASEPLRILVAEDDAVSRGLLLEMLARLGHRVDVTTDGREVVAAAGRAPYDVILMDVQMPGIDGLEATRRIRAATPAGDGPYIVAMTAHALPQDRRRCLDAGMDEHFAKPYTLDVVAAALAACPRLRRAAGRAEP